MFWHVTLLISAPLDWPVDFHLTGMHRIYMTFDVVNRFLSID